jgi:hypothetical protein
VPPPSVGGRWYGSLVQRSSKVVIGFVVGIVAAIFGPAVLWGPYAGLLGFLSLGVLALVALVLAIFRDACCRHARHVEA